MHLASIARADCLIERGHRHEEEEAILGVNQELDLSTSTGGHEQV